MKNALEVLDLHVRFGAIHAVRGISFSLHERSATALLGANGAGKSSTLLAITGTMPSPGKVSGEIGFASGANVSMVPERGKIFDLLTVSENLVAADRERGRGRVRIDDVLGWFPRLAERRLLMAGNLSGGEQQMLAIGMALLGSPSVLLIDEPTLGLAVPVIERLCGTLKQLRRDLNLTLLIAEAEVHWLAELAEETLVLSRGQIIERITGDLAARREHARSLILGLEPVNAS